jgi:hypothetical protein
VVPVGPGDPIPLPPDCKELVYISIFGALYLSKSGLIHKLSVPCARQSPDSYEDSYTNISFRVRSSFWCPVRPSPQTCRETYQRSLAKSGPTQKLPKQTGTWQPLAGEDAEVLNQGYQSQASETTSSRCSCRRRSDAQKNQLRGPGFNDQRPNQTKPNQRGRSYTSLA